MVDACLAVMRGMIVYACSSAMRSLCLIGAFELAVVARVACKCVGTGVLLIMSFLLLRVVRKSIEHVQANKMTHNEG